MVSIEITSALHARLLALAERRGTTPAAVVQALIARHIEGTAPAAPPPARRVGQGSDDLPVRTR